MTLDKFEKEFFGANFELGERYRTSKIQYPQSFATSRDSSFLIYALVRSLKPRVILEMGVANGHSTFVFLKAIQANGSGHLIYTNVQSSVAQPVTCSERSYWNLEIINPRNTWRSFQKVVDRAGKIDFFMHDSSNHDYKIQMNEYTVAYDRIVRGGILSSDDVDKRFAFVDFARAKGLVP